MDTKPSITTDTYDQDKLIAGTFPRVTTEVTVAAGADLTRGALVGKITASGKYALSASAAVDGSQTPVGVLVEDAAAAGGDVTGAIYEAGEFNQNAMTFGTGHTAASVRDGLAARGIHLKDSTPA